MEKAYYEKINIANEKKLRKLQTELPHFCHDFFVGIEPTTSSRTRIAYAYDLGIFFHYLQDANPIYRKIAITDFKISLLEEITVTDIEEYLSYLRFYIKDDKEYTNDEIGITRKLSSLKSFYNYFYKKEAITNNPAALVDLPKRHEKNIIRLDIDEVVQLLDEIESGDDLTEHQKAYHKRNKIRDLALVTLLLGTGIRVSECVGIDLNDLDFKNNGVKVHRKGGSETVVYFGDEVREALIDYLRERESIIPSKGHENAVFLSMQNKRISVRTVENLVKKYASLVTTLKKITPHKLRSTYGTSLYQETGDIYLVADVLGHKDINTTRKHYAAQTEERRRQAAKAVHLREEK